MQENITECEITVDPKYHRHFVARRGQVLREIADENGNVTVSFPRNGSKSDRVMVKGAKNCVEAATARIAEIVADLVRIVVWTSSHHERTLYNHPTYCNSLIIMLFVMYIQMKH